MKTKADEGENKSAFPRLGQEIRWIKIVSLGAATGVLYEQ